MVQCPKYSLLKLGCYNARDPSQPNLPRAVPELLLTTDSSNSKYVGYERATFPTYRDFLERYSICTSCDYYDFHAVVTRKIVIYVVIFMCCGLCSQLSGVDKQSNIDNISIFVD